MLDEIDFRQRDHGAAHAEVGEDLQVLFGLRHPAVVGSDDQQRQSMEPTPATMFFTKSSWPGTSTIPSTIDEEGLARSGSSRCAKPRSMVIPRSCSSGRRSGSVPVSALIKALLP